ncbi:MAG: VWA domain-containing protein [Phycisphaerales bacterium]|nr:VWA domain-containing protein [Phycisphaerales bacterium]
MRSFTLRQSVTGIHSIGHARRATAAVQVLVCMTTLLGVGALVIDVGMLYNTKAELQKSADAAALAAATELGNAGSGDVRISAREKAQQFATGNQVLSEGILLDPGADIVFGRAFIDSQTGRYQFVPDAAEPFPNAVRVIARRAEGSLNKPVSLYFAQAMGISARNLTASATAVLIPRDIVVVADLSASHTYDSQLRSMKQTSINLRDVWTHLPNNNQATQTDGLGFTSAISVVDNFNGTSTIHISLSSDASEATKALSHVTFGIPEGAWATAAASATTSGSYAAPSLGVDPTTGVAGIKFDAIGNGLGEDGAVETHDFSFTVDSAYVSEVNLLVATKAGQDISGADYYLSPGPTFGNMNRWGTETLNSRYNPSADTGLLRLPYNQTWSDSNLRSWLGAQGYIQSEIDALMSSGYDSSGYYPPRVAVALGLARWRSGIPGGLWQKLGEPAGNANPVVGNTELTWLVEWPYNGGSWNDYINYVKANTMVSLSNGNFRYRYGLKTLVNYMLDKYPEQVNTPELADCPVQPMEAVKEAAAELITIVRSLDSSDQIGLAAYGTYGYGPADKPHDLSWLTDEFAQVEAKIHRLQAGMWTRSTNIAQGVDKGVRVLYDSEKARAGAAKIMILLTDGNANQTRSNPTYWDEPQARMDTLAAAREARGQGIRIYTVSVGVDSDTALMSEVAAIGDGESFHAEGSISDYSEQLTTIFRDLGGKRPVVLID